MHDCESCPFSGHSYSKIMLAMDIFGKSPGLLTVTVSVAVSIRPPSFPYGLSSNTWRAQSVPPQTCLARSNEVPYIHGHTPHYYPLAANTSSASLSATTTHPTSTTITTNNDTIITIYNTLTITLTSTPSRQQQQHHLHHHNHQPNP